MTGITSTTSQMMPNEEVPYTVAPPGYRLPGELRLGPVRLQVADLGRSVEYYQRVIGLSLIDSADTTATLGAQESTAPIVALYERKDATFVSPQSRLGLYHFAILLPDRAALGRFLAHLADLGARAGMADHLVSEALYLSDPDGLGIEIYADRPRSSWRTHGSSIEMATAPLDVRDLVRAGGDEPWTGVPAGTRMGHVHLHVDNLESAAAFYHRALGFDKVTLSYPGALFMSAGGYHHHLGTNTWAADASISTDEDARLLEWTIFVPHQDAVNDAARSLRIAGFDVSQDANGDAVSIDPTGTRVRISADGRSQ
ncbi:MAG TPA: VOC family protein [Gemmatimonadaceae bacterium]|nr:VOC family protein [Gemmatimonadaceae bacterium]